MTVNNPQTKSTQIHLRVSTGKVQLNRSLACLLLCWWGRGRGDPGALPDPGSLRCSSDLGMHRLQEMKGKQEKDRHQENGAHHSQKHVAANEQRVCYLLNNKKEQMVNNTNNTLDREAFMLGESTGNTFYHLSLLATRCQERALVSWMLKLRSGLFTCINCIRRHILGHLYSTYCSLTVLFLCSVSINQTCSLSAFFSHKSLIFHQKHGFSRCWATWGWVKCQIQCLAFPSYTWIKGTWLITSGTDNLMRAIVIIAPFFLHLHMRR